MLFNKWLLFLYVINPNCIFLSYQFNNSPMTLTIFSFVHTHLVYRVKMLKWHHFQKKQRKGYDNVQQSN